MRRARRGTPSRVSRIRPWAAGGAEPLPPTPTPGLPHNCILKRVYPAPRGSPSGSWKLQGVDGSGGVLRGCSQTTENAMEGPEGLGAGNANARARNRVLSPQSDGESTSTPAEGQGLGRDAEVLKVP
ncbi:hypothetical protein VULLAG_LOCUS10042 [Vulpes lagopus]